MQGNKLKGLAGSIFITVIVLISGGRGSTGKKILSDKKEQGGDKILQIDFDKEELYSHSISTQEFQNAYIVILEEFERVWEDETYDLEQWKNVDKEAITLISYSQLVHYRLGYSLADLTSDGFCELVIGILEGEYEEYLPIAVYKYTKGGEFKEQVSSMYRSAGITLY